MFFGKDPGHSTMKHWGNKDNEFSNNPYFFGHPANIEHLSSTARSNKDLPRVNRG